MLKWSWSSESPSPAKSAASQRRNLLSYNHNRPILGTSSPFLVRSLPALGNPQTRTWDLDQQQRNRPASSHSGGIATTSDHHGDKRIHKTRIGVSRAATEPMGIAIVLEFSGEEADSSEREESLADGTSLAQHNSMKTQVPHVSTEPQLSTDGRVSRIVRYLYERGDGSFEYGTTTATFCKLRRRPPDLLIGWSGAADPPPAALLQITELETAGPGLFRID
ncbi:hypothetical protein MKZ38_002097 [Zalerion maritima]|uniref:Uncharacterized protein n=1 Tax=Zalerion maritima TaxID=339359 RepID=A0AAD5RPI4_9PEZI|nr:hypothetical protein MKZ38_002097 [Zalerion maritima]